MPTQLQFDFDAPPPPRKQGLENSPRPPPVLTEPELPRDVLERGYAALRNEQEEALRQLEARFGVVLNRRVRVTLTGFPNEFVGLIQIAQLLHPSKRGEELRLRIGPMSFDHGDVESCVVVDEGGLCPLRPVPCTPKMT
jgi:hypothetical protein